MLSADRKFQEAENMRKSLEADRAKYLKVRALIFFSKEQLPQGVCLDILARNNYLKVCALIF
jgi:hypothetical protein